MIYGDIDALTISLVNDFIKRVGQDESIITEVVKNQKDSELESNDQEV